MIVEKRIGKALSGWTDDYKFRDSTGTFIRWGVVQTDTESDVALALDAARAEGLEEAARLFEAVKCRGPYMHAALTQYSCEEIRRTDKAMKLCDVCAAKDAIRRLR